MTVVQLTPWEVLPRDHPDRQSARFVTGHRPPAIGGYRYFDAPFDFGVLKEPFDRSRTDLLITEFLLDQVKADIHEGATTFISGGAAGIDLRFAEVVLEHKRTYPDIRLLIAQPYPSQGRVWPKVTQDLYRGIIEQADEVVAVSADPPEDSPRYLYSQLLHLRNMWMVDHSWAGIGVHNQGTTKGGTWNCLCYAQKQAVPMVIYDPISRDHHFQE